MEQYKVPSLILLAGISMAFILAGITESKLEWWVFGLLANQVAIYYLGVMSGRMAY